MYMDTMHHISHVVLRTGGIYLDDLVNKSFMNLGKLETFLFGVDGRGEWACP